MRKFPISFRVRIWYNNNKKTKPSVNEMSDFTNISSWSVMVETPEYRAWIVDLKTRYQSTQIKAAISVNAALLEYYLNLGRDI